MASKKKQRPRAAQRRRFDPAEAVVWALLLVTPFLLSPTRADSFDLPKLLAAEWLGLASLAALAFRLWSAGRVDPLRLLRRPAVAAVLPLVAVAAAGLATSAHPAHVRTALADLAIGAACLAGWSIGFTAPALGRMLRVLLVPAAALAVLAALQYHGLYRPFEFAGGEEAGRLGVTSLVGNPGVLGGYLVLPALVAQAWLADPARRRRRPAATAAVAAALALSVYGLVVTQTLAALGALAVGSAVVWLVRLPGRRSALALVAAGAVALGAMAAVPPLRARVIAKGHEVLAGQWNRALTGRLDGWRAAVWMIGERPLAGVGQGAYSAEFAPAKLALAERGTRMFGGRGRTMFVNAHNDPLEAAAEWGLPGAVALGWALWLLVGCLRRAGRALAARGDPGAATDAAARSELALAWGATAALAVLAVLHFPFRLGAVAFPALLLLAWVFRLGDPAAEETAAPAAPTRAGAGGGRTVPRRWLLWPALGLAVAALALHTLRARDLLEASRILRQVEQVSVLAASSGRGAAVAPIYWANLKLLQRAERLAPADSRLPLARGSQYLLLGRPGEAMAAYRRALAVEPRPEIYLNLGRAALGAGEAGEARVAFSRALTLDRFLRDQVPEEMRPARIRRRLRSPAR